MFVELTVNNQKRTINFNFVEDFWGNDEGKTAIAFSGGEYPLIAEESYEQVRSDLDRAVSNGGFY